MNTILSANKTEQEAIAFELLETQRNTLLNPISMYLIQAINFDYHNTHVLVGITVYQDCLELIKLANITYAQVQLQPIDLIKIALNGISNDKKPIYLENHLALGFVPIIGLQEFYPDEIGMTIHRPLMMSVSPFKNYTILKT